jgi:hypothetical protein
VLVGERIGVDLAELARQAGQRAPQLGLLEGAGQEMAGADLGLAEQQRRVVPT